MNNINKFFLGVLCGLIITTISLFIWREYNVNKIEYPYIEEFTVDMTMCNPCDSIKVGFVDWGVHNNERLVGTYYEVFGE